MVRGAEQCWFIPHRLPLSSAKGKLSSFYRSLGSSCTLSMLRRCSVSYALNLEVELLADGYIVVVKQQEAVFFSLFPTKMHKVVEVELAFRSLDNP